MADDGSLINEVLAETSFLYGGNAAFVEDLYAKWAANPASVDASWQAFFASLNDRAEEVKAAAGKRSWTKPGAPAAALTSSARSFSEPKKACQEASTEPGSAAHLA